VAHSLSAKKRIRQNAKRRARNRWRKNSVKQVIRDFDEAVRRGDAQEADGKLRLVYKQLDKVASKGSIHKNTASRKKSRLARRLAKVKV